MSALTNISSIADVKAFFTEMVLILVDEFHPDDDFSSYKHKSGPEKGLPIFTPEEIEQHNNLLAQCFDVCDATDEDIYDLGWEIIEEHLDI